MKEGGKKKSEGEGGRGRNRDGELSVPITLKPYGSGRTTTTMISTHNPCVHGKYIHRVNQIFQPDLFLNHLNLIMPIPSRKSFSIYPSPYICMCVTRKFLPELSKATAKPHTSLWKQASSLDWCTNSRQGTHSTALYMDPWLTHAPHSCLFS